MNCLSCIPSPPSSYANQHCSSSESLFIVDLSLTMTIMLYFLSIFVLKQTIAMLNSCWTLQPISFLELLIIVHNCDSI